MTLRDALYEVMQRTRDETPEGAEFTNSGDWEQWTEVILSDPAFREALVDGLRTDYDCCAAHDDIRGDEEHIVARMLGDDMGDDDDPA